MALSDVFNRLNQINNSTQTYGVRFPTDFERTKAKKYYYDLARRNAELEYSMSDSKSKERADLVEDYTDYLKKAYSSTDAVEYYKNRIKAGLVHNDIADLGSGLEKAANIAGDVWAANFTGAQSGVAGIENALNKFSIDADFFTTTPLKGNYLYYIATSDKGKDFSEGNLKSLWEVSGAPKLAEYGAMFPQSEKLQELVHAVYDRDYKGSKEDMQKLVDDAVEEIKNGLQDQFVAKYTQGAVTENQKHQLKEQLTYGNDTGAFNTSRAIGNLYPTIAASYATGGTLGALGWGADANSIAQAVGLSVMGTSVYGNAFEEARGEGYNWNRSGDYALAVTATEVGTELLSGEALNTALFGKVGTTPLGKLVAKGLEKRQVTNVAAKGAISILTQVAGEATEEGISQALQPIYDTLILDRDYDWRNYGSDIFKAMIDSLGVTAILTGVGVPTTIKAVNAIETDMINQIKDTDLSTDEKAKIIKQIQQYSAEAKVGFTDNFDKIRETVLEARTDSATRAVKYLTALADFQEAGDFSKEAVNAFNEKMKKEGTYFDLNNSSSQMTTQEVLDESKKFNVSYANESVINDDFENLMRQRNDIASIDVEKEITAIQQNLKKLVEAYTGKQVVYANVNSGEGQIDYGFTLPKSGNNIYIDSKLDTKSTISTAFHEIGHHLQEANPVIFNEFKTKLKQKLGDQYDNYIKEYQKIRPEENLTEDDVVSELFGDYIGEISSKPGNAEYLDNSVKSTMDKIKSALGKASNRLLGTEYQNQDISAYNLGGTSYMNGDILGDKAFEKLVLESLKDLKKGSTQVEEATKKTEEILKQQPTKPNAKTPSDDVKTRIEEKYKAFDKKLVNMKTVKEMIANELGVEYNDPQVEDIYKQLKKYGEIGERIKLSAKKINYSPEIDATTKGITTKFGIKNINDWPDVINKVAEYFEDSYLSTNDKAKPITNIDMDMKIEIWKSGINETFGNADYYSNLSREEKLRKLATMEHLAQMVKYGEVRLPDQPDMKHPNSPARFYYLRHPIIIDGEKYIVTMDIKKVPNQNGRFYIHSIQINNATTRGKQNARPSTAVAIKNIQQNRATVKIEKDDKGRTLSPQMRRYNDGNKFVDNNNQLLTMYHGTPSEKPFSVFDEKRIGSNQGQTLGAGFYLTTDQKVAQGYIEEYGGKKKGHVMEVYGISKNPFYMDNTFKPLTDNQAEYLIRRFDRRGVEDISPQYFSYVRGKLDNKYQMVDYFQSIAAKNNTDTRTIFEVLGYDGIKGNNEYVVFRENQIKDVTNQHPTERKNIHYSSRKETNTEKIINNQRNEIERLSTQADDLKAENKGLKKIIKGLKSTGRQQIKNVQSESNKMLKVGRETELKMRGQLEREGKKYNKLTEVAVDLKLERELERTARKDGINFPREYKGLYIGLRRAGDSIKDAYATTRSIFDESQAINKYIDDSINILKEPRKNKIYNKLPNDIKAKINEYANIWTGSRNQSALSLAKRVLSSLTARELRENGVNLTKSVRNQIMSEEGYGWENGKGSKSLQELFNGSKELARAFNEELNKLRKEVADFRARNLLDERTKELNDTIIEAQDAVSNEIGKKGKPILKSVFKTNNTLANSQMTLKTEIQALMGGNINTPLMILNNNLQKGEIRKKQAVVEVYKVLSEFMQRSKGANYALNTERWSPTLEKSLSIKSEFVDTGMMAYDKKGNKVDIKIPRSMIMSLAMHLLNQDNMSHISGAITGIATDDSGNQHIRYGKGEGIRIPNEELYRAGKEQDAYDTGVTVRLTEEQVEGIANMLTDEEKAFVKAVSEVFKYTSELINEVSNRILGYDLATVENYFPIRVWESSANQVDSTSASLNHKNMDALTYMLTPGWLQERVTSFNPIYLENIGEVLNRVVNNVTNFYGYAEALRDNNILLNSAMPDGTSLKRNIGELSSSFMSNYNRLARFITGQESIKNGMFRNLMAANTLTFNVGTWLTQPMSFFNTIKYFSGKEFMSAINPANNNAKLNKMIREYFDDMGIDHTEYNDYQVARAFIAMATPNLEHRAIGYKIPELNQLYNKSIEDKLGAHGIEALDNIAVTAIARMMAYSVALDPNIKFGSEEYFDVLGERLTQVLVETQPEFSQVNRANMFRSNNGVMRMLSLFGTPANQMFNNFLQSAMQVKYEAREGNISAKAKTDLAKSISGIILSSTLVGLVRALRDALRDDKDEASFTERWIAQSTIAMLGPTLILDDVAQFIMGQSKFGGMNSYDFNTPETTFMNGITNLAEKIAQLGNGDISVAKKTKDIIRALGVLTPIDTKSLVRVVEALMKFIAPDTYKSYSLQNDTTIYKQWQKHQDSDMATFYTAYTATREKNLAEKYGYHKADKSKGIKSNLKEAREKALKDVLKNQNEVNKYMELLFDYKN